MVPLATVMRAPDAGAVPMKITQAWDASREFAPVNAQDQRPDAPTP
jgi:hypothetical protein